MNFGNRKIETSNASLLGPFESTKVQSALSISFDKMQRIVKNELVLHAHFKRHETGGKRAKHSVHLKLSLPGHTLVASESGWNPVNVLQRALDALERETIKSVKRH